MSDKEIILVGLNDSPESLGLKKEKHIAFMRAAKIWGKVKIFTGNGFGEFTQALY